MKKILGLKTFVTLTTFIMLVGTIVFTFGFGSTIYIAKQDVENEANQRANQSVKLIQNYVDDQLQRVEDVAYTLLSTTFTGTSRKENGEAFVTIDPTRFVLPSEEKVYEMLESFINTNPFICGAAIGFEPFLYRESGPNGFAAYISALRGNTERYNLGKFLDFRKSEWYEEAATRNRSYWSHPFREPSQNTVVTSFSIPLHGYDRRIVGVLSLVINTQAFHDKCNEVSPFPGAEVAIADADFRFISHTNESYITKSIAEIEQYQAYQYDDSIRIKMLDRQSGHYAINKGSKKESMFYFAPVERAGWMISIECPKEEIYGSVDHMKKVTGIIAAFSMLFMILCFVLLFRRMQSVTEKKAGIERDLQIASAIQISMLPKLYPAFPDRKDLDVYGFLKPAKSVGGDLYDYFIKDGKFFFCIGDVSGKGVPASLFMAVIRALFRNISLHVNDPAMILSALNTALSDGNTHNMFCTMFLGVLDLETGHMDYCNAGHNSPVIRRLGKEGIDVHFASPLTNIALGVFDGFPYVKEETTLAPGEAIFMYTDGVTEAENAHKQLFGDNALLKALADARQHEIRSAKDFVDYVYGVIKSYAHGTAEQSDDITMLVVEYKGQQD